MRHPMANTIQRVFKMSFVPVGFWQRFIARMLISLAEMDLQVAPERIRHRDGWASKSILLGGKLQLLCWWDLTEGCSLAVKGLIQG